MSRAYKLTKVMTISDMAYKILKERKESMHYKELFKEISEVKQIKNSSSVQSCIYSEDKFIRMGDGYWGLKEWLLNGLSFVYSIKPLEYQRQTLKIDYDHELYFPYYIQHDEINIEFRNRKYIGIRKDKQTFALEEFYNNEQVYPKNKLIIKILNVNNFDYQVIDLKQKDEGLELDNLNQRIADLAFEVLKEKRGIMSITRILEHILIKILKTEGVGGKFKLGPLMPLSKILSSDKRFSKRLSGMFALNI